MLTAAAGVTINRLPVLLLPGDIFARRNVAPTAQCPGRSATAGHPSTYLAAGVALPTSEKAFPSASVARMTSARFVPSLDDGRICDQEW